MASVEHRVGKTVESWRIVWRQDGRKQSETFPAEDEALEFKEHVEAGRSDSWPRGWTPGRGWDAEADDGPTFTDYAERTLAARGKADAGTKATYGRMLANHVTPHIGSRPLTAVTRFDVAAIGQRMLDAGLSPKTVANIHALVSSVLSDAVRDRIIDRNPAEGAMPSGPSSKTEDMVFLSRGEFALLCSHIKGEQNQRLARLLVGTGLRWSEATALKVGDVDLLGRSALDVRRAWKRRGATFELGEPKTRRSRRTVSLSAELREVLIPQIAAKGSGEFVFTAPGGGEIRHANWYHRVWVPALLAARYCTQHRAEAEQAARDWRNAVRRAGKARVPVEDQRPDLAGCGCPGTLTKTPKIHSLRHTQASWLIEDKVSLVAVQRRLGHESITTTIDRYGHLAPEHVAEVDAAVDRALATR